MCIRQTSVRLLFLACCLGVHFVSKPVLAGPPVQFEIEAGTQYAISPYIYGANQPNWQRDAGLFTLTRFGGNRTTTYNWENNASNAGADWNHQNDGFLSISDVSGEAVRQVVSKAHAAGASVIVTIPILGYVAADKQTDGDVKQTPDYLRRRFRESLPKKGDTLTLSPEVNDLRVFQDEFVHWLESVFPESKRDATRTIFFALDNEPELWPEIHPRLHPEKVRYDELIRLNIEYAAAIKAVAPYTLVFGPVLSGWQALTSLQDAPDAQGRDFTDYYLQKMQHAQRMTDRRLLDVLDLHWYPEALGNGHRITEDSSDAAIVAARIQAPRSLWDPKYVEDSWITKDVLHGPIKLLPRMHDKIQKYYPGTRLAITEYYYGGGNDISGAIAQADVLGIFGRQGVFAATLWHLGKTDDAFIRAGFKMFRNFDGQGSCFGDVGLAAKTNDPENTSVYASLDAQRRVIIVAINKTKLPLLVQMRLKHVPPSRFGSIYSLTKSEPQPVRLNDILVDPAGRMHCELPALSVSTIVLTPMRHEGNSALR